MQEKTKLELGTLKVIKMKKLCDLVEIIENNKRYVTLKVKDDVQLQLICLSCFDGTETMFRLTKGKSHTCTIFRKGEQPFSWTWGGANDYTLVSHTICTCGYMIETCISKDLGINIGEEIKEKYYMAQRDNNKYNVSRISF